MYLVSSVNIVQILQTGSHLDKYGHYLPKFDKAETGLLNKTLMLSTSFRCDQIYKYEIYNFGHTLLCYLSRTYMFNKPTSGDCYQAISYSSLLLLSFKNEEVIYCVNSEGFML